MKQICCDRSDHYLPLSELTWLLSPEYNGLRKSCDGEVGWHCSALLALKKRESLDKSITQSFLTLSLSTRQAGQISPYLVPHNNKGFISLQFIQELSYQNPCWDQARISSLITKQLTVQQFSLVQYSLVQCCVV